MEAMKNKLHNGNLKRLQRAWLFSLAAIGLMLVLMMPAATPARAQSAVSFLASDLQSAVLDNPTSLQFGPDGRLYVAQQNGLVRIYTIARNGAGAVRIAVVIHREHERPQGIWLGKSTIDGDRQGLLRNPPLANARHQFGRGTVACGVPRGSQRPSRFLIPLPA